MKLFRATNEPLSGNKWATNGQQMGNRFFIVVLEFIILDPLSPD
jgi:hypothetical protein